MCIYGSWGIGLGISQESVGPFRLFPHHFPYAAAVQLDSIVFLELFAGPLERLLRAKVGQGPLQGQRLAPAFQAGQLLERPVAVVVFGAAQIRRLDLNRAEAAQPPQGLPPV